MSTTVDILCSNQRLYNPRHAVVVVVDTTSGDRKLKLNGSVVNTMLDGVTITRQRGRMSLR